MGIKETPTNIKVYYNSMKEAITRKHKETVEAFDSLRSLMSVNYEEIKSNIDTYKKDFKVDLTETQKDLIANANSQLLEKWGTNFMHCQSIQDVFKIK